MFWSDPTRDQRTGGSSGAEPGGPSLPAARFRAPRAVVAAFTERVYRCHHCGAGGAEGRDTDQIGRSACYRWGTDTLLLPFCPACPFEDHEREQAGAELVAAVIFRELAWVDPRPLVPYICPVASCGLTWHHLGVQHPFPVVPDVRPDGTERFWHPCPWCVADDLPAATRAFEQCRDAMSHLRHWEGEFGHM